MADSPANQQPVVRPSPRYLAQVKAFLSYIEDVEVDEETIEDILVGLDDFYLSVISDGDQSDTPRNDNAESDPDGDEDEFAQEGEVYFDVIHLLEELIWSFGFSR